MGDGYQPKAVPHMTCFALNAASARFEGQFPESRHAAVSGSPIGCYVPSQWQPSVESGLCKVLASARTCLSQIGQIAAVAADFPDIRCNCSVIVMADVWIADHSCRSYPINRLRQPPQSRHALYVGCKEEVRGKCLSRCKFRNLVKVSAR